MDIKEKRKKYVKKSHDKAREDALNIVGKGKIVCINCGCKAIGILEINHIKCNGYKERKATRASNGWSFYYDIIKNRRKTDDLNILCKVCNVAYHVETKFGIKHKVTLANNV